MRGFFHSDVRSWPDEAVKPPSQMMVSPTVKFPAREERKIARPPTSSAVPILFIGFLSTKGS